MKKLTFLCADVNSHHKLIILDIKIGYIKIKFQKIRFINYFEAKRKGLRSTASEIVSQTNFDDGNVS